MKSAAASGWSLDSFLRSHFGRAAVHKPGSAGNIGIATLHLSRPPGRTVVITLGASQYRRRYSNQALPALQRAVALPSLDFHRSVGTTDQRTVEAREARFPTRPGF